MRNRSRGGRFRGLLDSQESDPLSGVANLFDAALVFSVCLIFALLARMEKPSMEGAMRVTESESGELEFIQDDGEKLDRYRVTDNVTGGSGHRLGVTYRLKTGEIVYVPEE